MSLVCQCKKSPQPPGTIILFSPSGSFHSLSRTGRSNSIWGINPALSEEMAMAPRALVDMQYNAKHSPYSPLALFVFACTSITRCLSQQASGGEVRVGPMMSWAHASERERSCTADKSAEFLRGGRSSGTERNHRGWSHHKFLTGKGRSWEVVTYKA